MERMSFSGPSRLRASLALWWGPKQVNKLWRLVFGLRDDYLSCFEFPSSKYNICDGTEMCSVCMIHTVNRAGFTQLIIV